MSAVLDYMRLCRLCLVKDKVHVPIFGAESDVRQIFLKITACLPVKVSQEDNLPKNICNSCLLKVDLLYQFWNTTVNAEKQLIQWLAEIGVDVNIKNTSPPNITPQSHAHPHSMPEAIILKEERPDPEIKSMEQSQNFHMDTQYSGYEMPYQPQVNMTVGAPTDFTQPTDAPAEEDVKVPQQKAQPTKPTPAKRRGRPPKQKTPPAVQLPPPEVPPAATSTATGSKRRSSAAAAAAAFAAAAANASSDESDVDDRFGGDDSDDEDMDVRIAKEEADSEDEEYVDNPESLEPTAFVGVPSTSACDSEQPGPSGLGGAITTGKTSSALPAAAANESGSTSQQQKQDPLQKGSGTNKFCILCNREFLTRRKYMVHVRSQHAPKVLPCKYCGKKFNQRSQLKLHERFHERVHVACEICNKKFGSVDEHKRRRHAKIFSHQCNKCVKVYKTEDELNKHKEEVHSGKPLRCEICYKEFSRVMYLNLHQKTHDPNDKIYKCSECDQVYEEIKDLHHHLEIVHKVTAPTTTCNICAKVLSSVSSLRDHKLRHLGTKPYSCEVCGKSFVTKKHVRVHMRIHTGEKPFPCLDCGKSFTQRYCLTIHRRLHTGERPHQCKDCDKTFLSKSALKVHERRVHDSVLKRFSHYCNECGKGFSSPAKLSHHKDADHLGIRYSCIICDKVFRSSYYLSVHVKTHDDNYKPPEFSCTQCEKVFETNRSLKKHILTVHENAPPAFMCDICGKRVGSARSLKDHKLIHSGYKPYVCNYCPKTFNKQHNLTVHIRTHTQERPYACEECGKAFTQIGTLKLHRRLHSGERPFKCELCEKRFVSKSALKLHVASHGTPLSHWKTLKKT